MAAGSKNHFPSRPRLIFMGTPDFSVPCLKSLVENQYDVLAVVTQPDRPKGRGRKVSPSPVKQAALEFGLEVWQPEKVSEPGFAEKVRKRRADLLIVVAFGQLLKKNLLEATPWGVLNIHASLLPKYRGAAPIQWAIFNDEPITGLTAMRMDEGLDTGPMVLQEEIPIDEEETAGSLHDKLGERSGAFLIKALKSWAENRINEEPQDPGLATYAPKIDRSMCWVDWNQSAKAISAQIRALDPWPGAQTKYRDKVIRLFSPRVKVENLPSGLRAGRVSDFTNDGIEIETANGLIRIGELQVAGKNRLFASQFLRGFPMEKGALLHE